MDYSIPEIKQIILTSLQTFDDIELTSLPDEEIRLSFKGTSGMLYDVYLDKYDPSAMLISYIFINEELKNMVMIQDVKEYRNFLIVKSKEIQSKDPQIDDQEQFKKILTKLVNFLKIIHSTYGLTHGDFTSSNILWKDNNPFIKDFERSNCFIGIKTNQKSNCFTFETFKYIAMIDYADLLVVINRRDVYKPFDKSDSLKLEIDKIQTYAQNIKNVDTEIEEDTLSQENKLIVDMSFENIQMFFKKTIGMDIVL
jgi:hypothetical protein